MSGRGETVARLHRQRPRSRFLRASAWLAAALVQPRPLTLIVPDAGGLQPPPDFAARIRRILGVESN